MSRVFFAWPLALALVLSGCKHVPTEKERQSSEIHYNLGVQAQQAGNIQEALSEFQRAVELDPENPDARNALGILLHLSFRRPAEAVEHYQKALEVRPDFSEARTNLANVHLDQGQYDQAIKLYEQVLNDMLYPTPFIAQGNLGWAYFKKGDTEKALENIQAAVTLNPNFCLGYKNLGLIHEQTGNTEQACQSFTRYREQCPEVADAYMREGVCLAKQGQVETARERLGTCESKASQPALKDECRRLREHL
ncbi:MAG: social motility TPR repeat lipoprotein Tgl [Myxococcaceae bacterium]|nr:social motility TPR repeat lipoprotein Tgl [Myxococcaceae bacterium]